MPHTAYAGHAAYASAIKRLKQAHAEEWVALVGDEREARGLPREVHYETAEQIRTKLARAEAQVAKYRSLLSSS